MDFLPKWLLLHKKVSVQLYGVDDYDDKYICIKMFHESGYGIFNMVSYSERHQLKDIFDEMYRQVITKEDLQ